MFRHRCILAVMAASLLVVSSSRAQLVEDYRFQGSVVDAGGKPLAGVQATLRNVENGSRIVFTTSADGRFDRRMIPHAVYEATFEKAGFVTQVMRLDWSASAPEPILKQARIVLESEAERARRDLGAKAGKLYEEAYAAFTAGDCSTASAKARQLLALGAGSSEYGVRFILARCLAMRDSTAAGVEEYRRVLALRPDLFEAHFDLAGLLEKSADHAGALAEYAQAAKLRPEDADVEYNAGAILFQLKDYTAARPHLERAVQLAPENAQAHTPEAPWVTQAGRPPGRKPPSEHP
jgi:tetratricopeptide (TPR) repeat protein